MPRSRFPSRGINRHVSAYIRRLGDLTGLNAVDVPAGDGRATHCLLEAGASVTPLDLFPDFLAVPGVECTRADLQKTLPVQTETADLVVSQEGIEHVSDPYHVLCELNRILKPGGTLLLTTPNLSNLRSRLSMFLLESDSWKRMPASEIDSIWFAPESTDKLYFGHLFLMNIQKLRSLVSISGFRIREVVPTDISPSSLALLIPLYPLLALASAVSAVYYLRKNLHLPKETRLRVFKAQIRLNLNLNILIRRHIFLVLEKRASVPERIGALREMAKYSEAVLKELMPGDAGPRPPDS